MLSNLTVVNRIKDRTVQPPRFLASLRHDLSGELAKRVPVFLGSFRGDLQSMVRFGIVGSEEDSIRGLDGQNPVARSEVQAISHVFR